MRSLGIPIAGEEKAVENQPEPDDGSEIKEEKE